MQTNIVNLEFHDGEKYYRDPRPFSMVENIIFIVTHGEEDFARLRSAGRTIRVVHPTTEILIGNATLHEGSPDKNLVVLRLIESNIPSHCTSRAHKRGLSGQHGDDKSKRRRP